MARLKLPRTVVALACVSLLTDVSSEMIYPLVPLFLTTVLGAGAMTLGAIEGTAESVASLLKLGSGWWSDRLRRRKGLVTAGYTLSSAVRPLMGLAMLPGHVFAIRVGDRVGKGIRTAPRDAILADSVTPDVRGRAFGFHQSADHLGAVLGPCVAFVLLQWVGLSLRSVFLLAAIPAVAAVAVLVLMVREGTGRREMMMVEGGRGGIFDSGGAPRRHSQPKPTSHRGVTGRPAPRPPASRLPTNRPPPPHPRHPSAPRLPHATPISAPDSTRTSPSSFSSR